MRSNSPGKRRRTLSRPVRLTLVAIAATTAVVIAWIAALNWNWLEPSLKDALPHREAVRPGASPPAGKWLGMDAPLHLRDSGG